MDVTSLRKKMFLSKKENQNKARVYSAILSTALLIAKEDHNREVNELDIQNAAKKENKIAQQAKDSGAPYLEETFEICEEFLPKTLSKEKTTEIINDILKSQFGMIMGMVSKHELSKNIDKKLASEILKEKFQIK